MSLASFIGLIVLFVAGVSFVLKLSGKRVKNFLLVSFIAAVMIVTLVVVGDGYRAWDARAVVGLFILTAVLGLFFALHKGL